MKKYNVRDLTLASVFAGIILVMALIPQIGFVTLMPGVSVVLVHIPVLVGVFLLPRRFGILLGLFFGIGSFIAALIYAQQPVDLAFRNPLISVLPRILFALAAYYVFVLLKKVENSFKLGKTMIFAIVAFISVFAVFYGTKAITTSIAFSEYTDAGNRYGSIVSELDNNDSLTQNEIDDLESQIADLETELPILFDEGVQKEQNALKYTMPLSLLIIVLFLAAYYHFIINDKKKEILYPSAFIISTIIHTILVLSALIIFKPALFGDALGFQSALTIIYTIAAANGLIEALVAVFVGTPIILAIENLKSKM